jgi:transposase
VSGFGVIEKLRRDHSLDAFDCGKEQLNRFLKTHALNNQSSDSAQTYVLADGLSVKGYYSDNKVALGFVEGLNNKIRVIQRRAYGLHDEEYLKLKILTCTLPAL